MFFCFVRNCCCHRHSQFDFQMALILTAVFMVLCVWKNGRDPGLADL